MKRIVRAVVAAMKRFNHPAASRPSQRFVHPTIECLEGRLAPATFVTPLHALPVDVSLARRVVSVLRRPALTAGE